MPISLKAAAGGGGFPIGAELLMEGVLPVLIDSDGQKWLKTGYIETNAANFDNTYWANTRATLWKQNELDSNKSVTGLAIKGNIVIAVGSDSNGSYFRKSTDGGVTWGASTNLLIRASGQVNDIIYSTSLNMFVTVHADGSILTSTDDGVSFQTRRSNVPPALNAIAFANNTFVAVGQTGTIITSPDGINWTSRTSGVTTNFLSVAYGSGGWLACANTTTDTSVYSSNLTSWSTTTITTSSSGQTARVFNDGTRFIACTIGVFTANTVTGPWTRLDNLNTATYRNGTFDGTDYYFLQGVGSQLVKTSDFINYTSISLGSGGNLDATKVYSKDGRYLICGSSSGSGSGRVLYGNDYLYAGQPLQRSEFYTAMVTGSIASIYYTRIS